MYTFPASISSFAPAVLAAVAAAFCAQRAFTAGHRWAIGAGWVLESAVPEPARAPIAWWARSRCDGCGERLRLAAALPLVGALVGCRCGARGGGAAPWVAEWAAAVLGAVSVGAPAPAPVLSVLVLCTLWAAAAAVERVALSVPGPLVAALAAAMFSAPLAVRAPVSLTGASVLLIVVLGVALHVRLQGREVVLGHYEWLAAAAIGAAFGPVLGGAALAVAIVVVRIGGAAGLVNGLGLGAAAVLVALWTLPTGWIVELGLAPVFPWLL